MKTLIKTFALFVTAFLGLSNTGRSQSINVDAVNAYWKLTDILKKNVRVTDDQWNTFIAIEGNKTYAESEFTPQMLAAYRRALEIAYMPKNDSLLKASIKANRWYCILAKRYKDEEPLIKAYLANTLLKPGYFNQAYQYVYEYLPKKAQHPVSNLNLYYNCLSNDAVSYPNGLFFSLLSVIDNAKAKTGTLEAHELHHRMRPAMDILNYSGKAKAVAARDTGILWAINAIPNEGIADMIDKTWELNQSGDPQGITGWLLDPAPAAIRSLDSAISIMASHKDTQLQTTGFYRNMLNTTVGHMPGFYMARIIVNAGYKKQMINNSADPFRFFLLYQKAAKKASSPLPLFSEVSIQYLQGLEKEYITNVLE